MSQCHIHPPIPILAIFLPHSLSGFLNLLLMPPKQFLLSIFFLCVILCSCHMNTVGNNIFIMSKCWASLSPRQRPAINWITQDNWLYEGNKEGEVLTKRDSNVLTATVLISCAAASAGHTATEKETVDHSSPVRKLLSPPYGHLGIAICIPFPCKVTQPLAQTVKF